MNKTALTRMHTSLLIAVIIVAAIVGTAGWYFLSQQQPSTQINEVNIGGVITLSGPQAEQGGYQRTGFELAVQEINDAGGIKALGGAKLVARISDAGATTDSAVSAYNRIKSFYGVSGFVGCYGSAQGLAVTEQCEKDKVAFITTALADALTGRAGYNYTFDTSPKASIFGVTVFSDAVEIARAKGIEFDNIAIVGSNAPSDLTTADTWKNMTLNAGLNLVLKEVTQVGLTDATPIGFKIKTANPDVLFLVFSTPADYVLLLDKMAELGVKPKVGPLMSGDVVLYPSVAALGHNITDGLTAAAYTWSYPAIDSTIQHLKNVTGMAYIPSALLAVYGHTYLYKEALERAASADAVKVRDALSQLRITNGPAWVFPTTSPDRAIEFDATGRIINATCVMVQWQNSIPYVIYPLEFATKPPL